MTNSTQLNQSENGGQPGGDQKPKAKMRWYWPFGFKVMPNGARRVVVDFKGLVVFVLVVFVSLWLLFSATAYVFVRYSRGMTEIKFVDMMFLPMRWKHYQEVRGNFFIEDAKKDLAAQKYREAFFKMRIGVAKAPANREGRQLLVQFYNVWRRLDMAETTLVEGIPYNKDNLEFMRMLYIFLLRQQNDEKVIRIAEEVLGKDISITPVRQLAAYAAATAYYYRGNYDKAEDLLRMYQMTRTRDGQMLLARIDWDRGMRAQALERLRQLLKANSTDAEAYGQLVTYLRQDGRDDEARRESMTRAMADPNNVRARIDLLIAYKKAEETENLKGAREAVFRDFGTNETALLALADFASSEGDVDFVEKIYTQMDKAGMKKEGVALMRVEALLVSKRYAEAGELLKKMLREEPDMEKTYAGIISGLQAIAGFGSGNPDAGQIALNTFLAQQAVRTENMLAVSKRLQSIGANFQARQVLATAVKNDVLNQMALSELIKVDMEMNNTDDMWKNVRTLLTMRRPAVELLKTIYDKLSSDYLMFAEGRGELLDDLEKAIKERKG